MVISRARGAVGAAVFLLALAPGAALAQDAPAPAAHIHEPPPADTDGQPPLFSGRDATGTAWLPDTTPMYGLHRQAGAWDVMVHGVAFVQAVVEPTDRHRTGGDGQFQVGSVNWGMVMARRRAGRGRFGLRGMFTAEPWTVPGCGSLNLLATGEICDGDTIHDRQHPHDFFMELAAEYERPLRGDWRWLAYAALAGEPALGPVGFPHRASAIFNPAAPMGHHWLDATHIAFGVFTTGVHNGRVRGELSLFNGREPDERRAGLEFGRPDSVAGRLTWRATDRLVMQASAGRLTEGEAALPPLPRADITRATVSAAFHRPLAAGGLWATTVGYGVNAVREVTPLGVFDTPTHALLAESALTVGTRATWFGRGEWVQKPGHDLHAHEYSTLVFGLLKLQAGYVRHLAPRRGVVPGIGAAAALNVVPPLLAPRYGGRATPGFAVFLMVRGLTHDGWSAGAAHPASHMAH